MSDKVRIVSRTDWRHSWGVRGGLVLLAAAGQFACNAADQATPSEGAVSHTAQALGEQAPAITAKWTKLGGAAVVGAATGGVTALPQSLPGEYQSFANGVIVSSDEFGAVYLSQLVFDKYLSLQTRTNASGDNLFVAVGLPVKDFDASASIPRATFVGGQIVVDSGVAHLVSGEIYLRWVTMADKLGAPHDEESAESGGGRMQGFKNGSIHWRSDLGAFVVAGAVENRYAALSGVGGVLGYPTSDTVTLNDGTSTVGHFEHGAIFANPATGAHELKGDLLKAYEDTYGGPGGGLGLPLDVEKTAPVSGDAFVDFQHGVLVNHTNTTFGSPGVYIYSNFDFYVDRLDSTGDDCAFGICGSQDMYWDITVTANGQQVFSKSWGDGDKSGWVPHEALPLPAINAATSYSVKFHGTDVDDGPDDDLGTTTSVYSIDNLWGQFETNDHSASSSDGGITGTYTIRNHPPYDPTDFLASQWWSFHNFDTADLSYDQFSATFSDVSTGEAWTHPFNKLWYQFAYRSIADGGNCYGMSVESLYSQRGESPYAFPLSQFFPDTQQGQSLDLNVDPAHASLANQINVKHGYQLGANQVAWFLAAFVTGLTHDPMANFVAGKVLGDLDEQTVVTMFDSYLFGSAHSMRVRSYEPLAASCSWTSAFCSRIHVADPNKPKALSSGDDFIEIDPSVDYYRYGSFSGGLFTGGRMFVTPFRLLSHQPTTPFANPLELLNNGLLIVAGNSGELTQAQDETGRTLFEPGRATGPARWDDLRHNAADRMTTLAPIPMISDSPLNYQMYAGKNVVGTTHTYDFAPSASTAANTPYDVAIESARQSAAFTIPGTPGKPDRVIASNIGTLSKAIELGIPSGSNAKAVKWTIGGAEKQRWAEFSNMQMSPAQKIKMHTEVAGYRVVIENSGPATSAAVRVNSGPKGSPVSLGTVDIPAGTSQIDFQLPKTDISVTGQVLGKNGWLVAPVTIALNAVEFTGRGFDAIEYSNDGVNWTRYTAPITYSQQGQTTFYYRARDKDLNQELAKSLSFRIDTSLPVATGTVSTTSGVKLNYAVTDATPGSGANGVHTLVNGSSGPVESYTPLNQGTLTLATSCSRVEYWAEDVAGNLQSPHAVIQDSVKPVFTAVPLIKTNKCTATAGLVLGVTATDDCALSSLTNNAPAHFPLGTTNVTWTAVDQAGNVNTAVQQVTTELGDDPSCCPVGSNIITGTLSNDVLTGTAGPDCILGLGGQDIIKGLGGDDALSGGDGNDSIWGGDGNDWVYGGTGQDTIYGEAGNDTLVCGDGADYAYGGIGDDTLYGGQGGDHLYCEAGNDTAYGEIDDDYIDGGTGNDLLNGGSNHDTYQGGGGTDRCVQDGGDVLNACTPIAP